MGSVTANKPTIILVHGAWHTHEYWSPVIEQLKEHGYASRAVSLPSVGGKLTTTMPDDAAHIQKTLSELVENGEDIVVVMHSYGGLPGTESVKGFLKKEREVEGKNGGVVSLVYVSAFLVPEGFSLASFLGEMPEWVKFDVSIIHLCSKSEFGIAYRPMFRVIVSLPTRQSLISIMIFRKQRQRSMRRKFSIMQSLHSTRH
jgi:pimeloyl-ACP methyl ester carboxylesterase